VSMRQCLPEKRAGKGEGHFCNLIVKRQRDNIKRR
jgi:hypothetical protein